MYICSSLVDSNWPHGIFLEQCSIKLPHLSLHLCWEFSEDLMVLGQLFEEGGGDVVQGVHDTQGDL